MSCGLQPLQGILMDTMVGDLEKSSALTSVLCLEVPLSPRPLSQGPVLRLSPVVSASDRFV